MEVLVASAGGHLSQLLRLRERLGLGRHERLWVTYDTPQGHDLASREPVVFGHGPSTRNVPAAIRNHRLARDLLKDDKVERVVSTGAGIAVPFLVEASRRGIHAEYVESATRVEGPSLSGRMLERVPGVRCLAQWPWGRRGWEAGPSVFDGFDVKVTAPPVGRPRRILVTLGTHGCYRFDRLVEQVLGVLAPCDEVVWQVGATPAPAGARPVVSSLSPPNFDRLVKESDVVIGHAGIGTALAAMANGKLPILAPRSKEHGEHVDDHQHLIAEELARRGLALGRDVEDVCSYDLSRASERVVTEACADASTIGRLS